jgi:hypothetical protein
MYKLFKNMWTNEICSVTKTNEDGSGMSIPLVKGNTDYANFKKEVLAGAELQNADGNTMTTEEANEYIGTLP